MNIIMKVIAMEITVFVFVVRKICTQSYTETFLINTSSILTLFGIKQIIEDRYECKLAALKDAEQLAQSNHCSIFNGLNGTADWYYLNEYTREVSKELKSKNRIQFDENDNLVTEDWNIDNDTTLHIDQSISNAIQLTHLDLHIPIDIRSQNTNDPAKYCDKNHRLIEFTLETLIDFMNQNNIDCAGYLDGYICDSCNETFMSKHDKVFHCGITECVYDRCFHCYNINHNNSLYYPYCNFIDNILNNSNDTRSTRSVLDDLENNNISNISSVE